MIVDYEMRHTNPITPLNQLPIIQIPIIQSVKWPTNIIRLFNTPTYNGVLLQNILRKVCFVNNPMILKLSHGEVCSSCYVNDLMTYRRVCNLLQSILYKTYLLTSEKKLFLIARAIMG